MTPRSEKHLWTFLYVWLGNLRRLPPFERLVHLMLIAWNAQWNLKSTLLLSTVHCLKSKTAWTYKVVTFDHWATSCQHTLVQRMGFPVLSWAFSQDISLYYILHVSRLFLIVVMVMLVDAFMLSSIDFICLIAHFVKW